MRAAPTRFRCSISWTDVLNAGVLIHGSLVISLAGVDLVYLGLNVVLTSVETALRNLESAGAKGNLK